MKNPRRLFQAGLLRVAMTSGTAFLLLSTPIAAQNATGTAPASGGGLSGHTATPRLPHSTATTHSALTAAKSASMTSRVVMPGSGLPGSAASFTSFLGVNTHLDLCCGANYGNKSRVLANVTYLGVRNLRDNPTSADVVNNSWGMLALVTGAKFDAYMTQGSVGSMEASLPVAEQAALLTILNYFEGGEEEDATVATANGNSLEAAAKFQCTVYAMGKKYNLPVINMSFGQNSKTSSAHLGDYGSVGDLSACADFANAQTYPQSDPPLSSITTLTGKAKLAAASRPVITTEFGYKAGAASGDLTEEAQAAYILDGIFDAYLQGNAKLYLYGLYDDNSGDYGLYRLNYSPKQSAVAVHNLIAILSDKGLNAATFKPATVSYSVMPAPSGGSLQLGKSDGTTFIAVWPNIKAGGKEGTLTLKLANTYRFAQVFDPMVGAAELAGDLTYLSNTAAPEPISTFNAVSSLPLTLTDHPLIVQLHP